MPFAGGDNSVARADETAVLLTSEWCKFDDRGSHRPRRSRRIRWPNASTRWASGGAGSTENADRPRYSGGSSGARDAAE